jgi:hypothetical protein
MLIISVCLHILHYIHLLAECQIVCQLYFLKHWANMQLIRMMGKTLVKETLGTYVVSRVFFAQKTLQRLVHVSILTFV